MSDIQMMRLLPYGQKQMRELNVLFGEAFDDANTYSASPPSATYLERLLADRKNHVVVAIEDGHVVGGLVAYELPKFEREVSELYIYDLAVAGTQRRRGIGKALIKHASEIASLSKLSALYVQAACEDEAAVGLYSKLGAKSDVFHFDLAISSSE